MFVVLVNNKILSHFYLEHIQYLTTIITDEQAHCREEFGMEFMLDVVRIYYSRTGSPIHNHAHSDLDNSLLHVCEEDALSIRGAILSAMKLYVMNDIKKEEVETIMRFITACQDSILVSKITYTHSHTHTCMCMYMFVHVHVHFIYI